MMCKRWWAIVFLVVLAMGIPARNLFGQADQGTITGVVQDPSGAVIGSAGITLTNTDLNQILKTRSDGAGIFIFSPVKIGNYKLTVSAPGFETTTQTSIHLDLQQRLNVPVMLKPGSATETVTVTTEEPLLQTQESSVGQTMDTATINSVPLNGRNWVYIAQLSAGAAPPDGSRGAGRGDFNANGQRAEENNFILDGVDNNANVVDFFNGASFVAQPPPDALAEFKVQTSDYSAEFGHSAGAVVNASIKSGTNAFHGSAWEYVRNTSLDAKDWDASSIPPYHENQFGATLGGPFWKNKLYFFGDAQASRVDYSSPNYSSVPTAKERTGDFSEILNPSLTGNSAVQLYQQSSEAAPAAVTGNCLAATAGSSTCGASNYSGSLDPLAVKLLNDYPTANVGNGLLYSNFYLVRPIVDNTFQWDARMDATLSAKDTAYSRYSYWNEMGTQTPPLNNTLDGGGFGSSGSIKTYGANFMASETHVFSPTITNEARLGYNYMHTGFLPPHADDLNYAQSLGLGGIPTSPEMGGLPNVTISGIATFGTTDWSTTDEHENVYQLLDNVTKIAGNHALKAGVAFQGIRFSTLQPQYARGNYDYTGEYTSNLNASNTGYGVADFLIDMQNNAGLSNAVTNGDAQWYDAAYFQDDWRINAKITVNLGVRWDFYQPYQDVGGYQASYHMTQKPTLNTTTGVGSGAAVYQIPSEAKSYATNIFTQTGNAFPNMLASNNIALSYTGDPHIVQSQHDNFAPRIGVSYSPDGKTVVRAGYGIFYGGLESVGYYPNRGENYPFQYSNSFPSGSCGTDNCPTDNITLENGFSTILANGYASNVSELSFRGSAPTFKIAYTENYNLSLERSFNSDLVATVSYVGDQSHHLVVFDDPNNAQAVENPNNNINSTRPLPSVGGTQYSDYIGASNYNSLQTKLEKRRSHGYDLLATYTWSHAFDDAPTPLGSSDDGGYRQPTLIPVRMDMAPPGFDVRQRFTFTGLYELPFGLGRTYLNQNKMADIFVGGWSANATFVAQTGSPFTVTPSGISSPTGFQNGPFAVKVKNPFAGGGTFQSPNPNLTVTCPTKVRNRTNWYNPCAFENPWNANDWTNEPQHYIPTSTSDPHYAAAQQPIYVTSLASAIGYGGGAREQIDGPGYERVNMSIFKSFKTYREQSCEFRADIFNVLNTPSFGLPNNRTTASAGGQITGPRSIQNDAPDARFFQLALKYSF